jgi:hypothetical protein
VVEGTLNGNCPKEAKPTRLPTHVSNELPHTPPITGAASWREHNILVGVVVSYLEVVVMGLFTEEEQLGKEEAARWHMIDTATSHMGFRCVKGRP